ncbi:SufD family Fe-S cluster assembly protein [symbiont of Argiope bruennichi]|uniref:SufD family Fe-S cluster assembly protein n=1 Tax=symbiont of Argiope bruennichi TaxID=2810479 RepID=UPI003DA4BD6D
MLATKNNLEKYTKEFLFKDSIFYFSSKIIKNLNKEALFFNFFLSDFYHKIIFKNCSDLKIFIVFEEKIFISKTFDFFCENCKNIRFFIFSKNSNHQKINFKFFLKKKSDILVNFLYLSKNTVNDFYFFVDHLGNETKSKVNIINFCYNKDRLSVICISRVKKRFINCDLFQDMKSFNLTQDSNIKNLPILDINNFENYSKHGCMIGDVSLDLYHYFFSKGIDKKSASNLIFKSIVISFLKEINEINLETIFYNNFYLNVT